MDQEHCAWNPQLDEDVRRVPSLIRFMGNRDELLSRFQLPERERLVQTDPPGSSIPSLGLLLLRVCQQITFTSYL